MSDLRLPSLASVLGKDARTVRRWCERGLVPGAYRTAGGHWRVKTDSPAAAGRAAGRAARGFARDRSGIQKAARGVARSFRHAFASVRRPAEGISRRFNTSRQRVLAACGEAMLAEDAEVALPASARSWLEQRTFTRRQDVERVLWGGLVCAMVAELAEKGRTTKLATAGRFKVSRRTLGRIFGCVWRAARIEAAATISGRMPDCDATAYESSGDNSVLVGTTEIDFCAMDSRNGWFEPAVV